MTTQTVTKGTAPSLSTSYDPATNRQTGESADANGNICSGWWNYSYQCPNAYTYDVENRIIFVGGSQSTPPTAAYSYAPGNKRVWRGNWNGYTQTVDEVTFWGANGQKLCTYSLSTYGNSQLVATATGTDYYFGGKLIKNATGYVSPDRLGSIGKYFPYGQERPSATQDGKEKFATYFRDSETGLDYADQRYHQPGMGRFMTPDPYAASGGPSDPGSWNRYAYTRGDPINRADVEGLADSNCPTFGICIKPIIFQPIVAPIFPLTSGNPGGPTDCMVYMNSIGGDVGLCAGGGDSTGLARIQQLVDLAARLGSESCTIAMYIDGACESERPSRGRGNFISAGILGSLIQRFGVPAAVAAGGWSAIVRWIGTAGENVVQNVTGLIKNSTAIQGTFSGINRIPDFWNTQTATIIEVKNITGELSLTSQIEDMMIWAIQNNHTFELWVNQQATLTPKLQSAVDAGLIVLKTFPWP